MSKTKTKKDRIAERKSRQITSTGKNALIKKKRNSEVRSYAYVKKELKVVGWNTNNPNRDRDGEVYTQQECLDNPEINSMLSGLKPEYIVKFNEDTFWVIEAKPTLDELEEAYEEACEYGELINQHKFIRAKIVSGVAGNDSDRYLVKSGFWNDEKKKFEIIEYHKKDIESLISTDLAKTLLEQNSSVLNDFDIDEETLLTTANDINEVLHAGSVKKDKRATIVATMLLSLLGETEPNYNDEPEVFVADINNRAKKILKKNRKEGFFKYLEVQLPEKIDAQKKFKDSLVSTLFTLKKINIKAGMRGGSDILGKFYESFLKYGNGAKDLGIVLTPRHFTKFVSEALDISHKDIVYDPTCGTGGFLVSAFYHVRNKSSIEQLDEFKQHRIFGIDQQSSVASLAIINMIFRGDGKNHIINDDCLARALIQKTIDGFSSAKFVSKKEGMKNTKKAVTKVLMNPPFALKNEDEKEYKFINHALDQMEEGGCLFSVLPYSVMIKRGGALKWRKHLLKNNTLLSVITLPEDLFYPSSTTHTIGVFIKKGSPHPKKQNVLWIRAINDGLRKKKGKRIPHPKEKNDLETVKNILSFFISNPNINVDNVEEFHKACPINFDDKELELAAEAYLDQRAITQEEIEMKMEELIRESASFIIKSQNEGGFL